MKTLAQDARYLWYTIFHPFNGFYELRFRRKKNTLLIVLLFALYGGVQILKTHYAGMLVAGDTYGTNNAVLFAVTVFPLLLFALSNWSVTTLFDGSGSLGDVLMVLAYALAPKIIIDLLYTAISNILVLEELVIAQVLSGFGMVLFGLLVFCGLCVVHEYLPAKNVVTLLATVAAALVILFIAMLYLHIIGKVVGFVSTVILEIVNRR